MSRQESGHSEPDEIVTRGRSTFRTPKGQYELWQRVRPKEKSYMPRKWWRAGRYKTAAQAQVVIDKSKRDLGGYVKDLWEFKIVGPGEAAPTNEKVAE